MRTIFFKHVKDVVSYKQCTKILNIPLILAIFSIFLSPDKLKHIQVPLTRNNLFVKSITSNTTNIFLKQVYCYAMKHYAYTLQYWTIKITKLMKIETTSFGSRNQDKSGNTRPCHLTNRSSLCSTYTRCFNRD